MRSATHRAVRTSKIMDTRQNTFAAPSDEADLSNLLRQLVIRMMSERNITQTELAMLWGTSRAYVNSLVKAGRERAITLKNLVSLAELLGYDVSITLNKRQMDPVAARKAKIQTELSRVAKETEKVLESAELSPAERARVIKLLRQGAQKG